jgi:hypothetical protein
VVFISFNTYLSFDILLLNQLHFLRGKFGHNFIDRLKNCYDRSYGGLQVEEINELKNLIKLAKTGHYPLFFTEWFYESFQKPTSSPLNAKNAEQTVQKTLENLNRHKNIHRKKQALEALGFEERKLFIRSFFKIVEDELLGETKTLQ